jgi:hypothetical protein
MLRREEQEAELAQEHVRRLMQEILEAKEARTAQLASHTEAVAELDASKRALEEKAKELEEELKTLKEQEKIEREHARVELAQLKKSQDEVKKQTADAEKRKADIPQRNIPSVSIVHRANIRGR